MHITPHTALAQSDRALSSPKKAHKEKALLPSSGMKYPLSKLNVNHNSGRKRFFSDKNLYPTLWREK